MFINRKKGLTTTQIIAFGFLGTILLGSLLLAMPFSTAPGQVTSYLDALFTSTTSVCVTGLVTVPTWSHWSIVGKVIITILMQIGGLGIITFTTIVLMVMGKRISLKERLLIQEAYNLDTLRGLVRMTLRIVKGTLIVEGIGMIFYSFVFMPEFGIIEGLGISAFNAVSAFCNAGMDIIGDVSLAGYRGNIIVNFTTIILIVMGGLGFPVWWNIIDILKKRKLRYNGWRDASRHFTLHTKVVLSMTAILILVGTLAVFLLEFNNPKTIGDLPFGEKVLSSLFQSVTTRTAGFLTIPQEELRNATAFFCVGLMFIGGSPSGTAGGIKTTTLGILLLAVFSIVRGRKDTTAFGRKISTTLVKKAMAVMVLSFSVMLLSVIALSIAQPNQFLDILYESTSAIATVGLSRGITAQLTDAGKIIIIITMYIGRIGPISLALFFNSKKYGNVKTYPTENIGVG